MEFWQSALFYTFLGYLLFHMVVDDLIHFVRAFYPENRNPHSAGYSHIDPNYLAMMSREIVSPAELVEDGFPRSTKISEHSESTGGYVAQPTPQPYFRPVSGINQRTIVLVVYKICDVILYCLMGYFHTFTTCWCASITCLDSPDLQIHRIP